MLIYLGLSKSYACFSCTKKPAKQPGPEFKYLYEHQAATSTPHSCKLISIFPAACAKSNPT